MSVVKIHTDDLQSIYDILGDLLSRKQGRPSVKAAEDLRSRASASQELLRAMLGIKPSVEVGRPPEPPTEPLAVPIEIPGPNKPEPAEELTVEETVEAIAAEITPEVGPLADAPEAVVEGDEAEA